MLFAVVCVIVFSFTNHFVVRVIIVFVFEKKMTNELLCCVPYECVGCVCLLAVLSFV